MNEFIPNHYQITLIPNLESFRFSGTVVIAGDLPSHLNEVTLNALELAIWRCSVTIDGSDVNCPFVVDPANGRTPHSTSASICGKAENFYRFRRFNQ